MRASVLECRCDAALWLSDRSSLSPDTLSAHFLARFWSRCRCIGLATENSSRDGLLLCCFHC